MIPGTIRAKVRTMRVLIVDDVAASRDTLRRALAFDDSIEVIGEAGSGPEAVDLTDELRPDLILMDVRMPGGNGVEATTAITDRFPDTKIIALTAHDDVDTVKDMLAAGAIGYFLKGAPVDDLLTAVRNASTGEGQIDPRVLPGAIDELKRLLREEQGRRADMERLAVMREEFMQVLSHELRTPLTVMAGALRFMQNRGLGPDESLLVGSALTRADDLERMIEGLELVAEASTPGPDSADPERAVRDAVTRLHADDVDLDLSGGPWPVRQRHLMRVAYELIGNAIKHGVGPVRVETRRFDDSVVLRVTDRGGFDPGPDVFEAFAQRDMSSTRAAGGLGLGLFITHRLCEADGGALTLRREGDLTVAEATYPAR